MLSRDHRAIYVHVRKSGGTTVRSLFPGSEHAPLNDGLLDPRWSDPEFDGYYRFAVVRNPYDRFISGWRYCASTRRRPMADVLRHPPRADLLEDVRDASVSRQARVAYAREWAGYRALHLSRLVRHGLGVRRFKPVWIDHDYCHLTRPQHALLVDADGRLAVDRVVFCERMAEGLAEVFADLGLPAPDVPHANRNPRRKLYHDYFDDETRPLLETLFAEDLRLFRYRFDTPEPAFPGASVTREAFGSVQGLTPARRTGTG